MPFFSMFTCSHVLIITNFRPFFFFGRTLPSLKNCKVIPFLSGVFHYETSQQELPRKRNHSVCTGSPSDSKGLLMKKVTGTMNVHVDV